MRRLILIALFFFLLVLPAGAEIVISEVMTSNGTYTNGEAYDWIELHNTGKKAVNLGGWYLSDSQKNLKKWAFPKNASIKADGYLLVYCTGKELKSTAKGPFYANFKLSSSGDQVYLTQKDGTSPAASLVIPPQYGNVSWGLPLGGSEYRFFAEATPGKKNAKTGFDRQENAPVILTAGGFYDGKITVKARAEEGAALRYTTDGSTPTEKSKAFPEKGLAFSATGVLRVRAFRDGCVPSPTVSATYWIGETHPVPVVSLITDSKYMFDTKMGALVKGSNADYPNYEHDWEYPVNIEYFNQAGACEINQMGTFTAAGHSARQNTQRSIALYARKAFGPDAFEFNPFPHRDYEEYHSLLLRSTNSDAFFCRLRDVVGTALAEGEGLLYQDALCIQVYINGRYWGHYNLREKINKYMVAQYEGVTDEDLIDQIDVISRTGTPRFTSNGSGEDWVALADFCKKNDLNDPDNLRYVTDRLDVESLFTHAAYQIILGNKDFTNVRLYRVPGGKWKYLLFDVEACFNSVQKTPLEYYIKPVTGKIQGFRHEPLNALLKVPDMKARFLTRVAGIMRDHFTWPYVREVFDQWEADIGAILPRHIARWKNLTMEKWDKNIRSARYYARVRPGKVPGLLKTAMKLTQAEVDTYFGEVLSLLEQQNAAD